ncbi:hypothetical protein L7F22_041998, partial [Adiantum nelumboides]|nr:hypothetical protein [Adiantum nelumboides]
GDILRTKGHGVFKGHGSQAEEAAEYTHRLSIACISPIRSHVMIDCGEAASVKPISKGNLDSN